MFLKSRKAFSLMEVMAAVAIVAVVTTISLSQYTSMAERNRDSRAQANLRQLRNSMETYFIRERSFTTNLGDLNGLPQDDKFNFQVKDTTASNFIIAAIHQDGTHSFIIDRDGNISKGDGSGNPITPGNLLQPNPDPGDTIPISPLNPPSY